MSDSPILSPRARQLVAAHDLLIACAAEAQAAAPELAEDLMAHARRLCDSGYRPISQAAPLPAFTAGQVAEIRATTTALYHLAKDALPFQPFELPAYSLQQRTRWGLSATSFPSAIVDDAATDRGEFIEVRSGSAPFPIIGRVATWIYAEQLMRAFALAVELVEARMVVNTPPPAPAVKFRNRDHYIDTLVAQAESLVRRAA